MLIWYRKLIAQKDDGSKNCQNSGRPNTSQKIINFVIRFGKENSFRVIPGLRTTSCTSGIELVTLWSSYAYGPKKNGLVARCSSFQKCFDQSIRSVPIEDDVDLGGHFIGQI